MKIAALTLAAMANALLAFIAVQLHTLARVATAPKPPQPMMEYTAVDVDAENFDEGMKPFSVLGWEIVSTRYHLHIDGKKYQFELILKRPHREGQP